jgi:DnaK suppressor protein
MIPTPLTSGLWPARSLSRTGGAIHLHESSNPWKGAGSVTSTVQDPIELLRDALESQLRRYSDQLADFTRYSRQPDRGGNDADTFVAMVAACRDAVTDTEAALRRMAEGTYGSCERCAANIPLQRLEILPHARSCAPCQQVTDRRNRLGP